MGRTANAQIRAPETLCRPGMNHPLPHPLAPVSELGLRPFSGRSGSISALSPLCSLGPPAECRPRGPGSDLESEDSEWLQASASEAQGHEERGRGRNVPADGHRQAGGGADRPPGVQRPWLALCWRLRAQRPQDVVVWEARETAGWTKL